jgi:uncharacterized protein (DUF1697 family)
MIAANSTSRTMTTFVALLRAVNLGQHGMIAMAELRTLLEKLGLADVRTLLQTGNVVFKADDSSAALEKQLEQLIQKRFAYDVPCCVRTPAEWKKIVAANPFSREAHDDPSHLLVFFLKKNPAVGALAVLQQAIVGREYFHANGRELYIFYPDTLGRTKFTSALIERKLGVRGTGRNWNTVQKIAAVL